MRPHHDPFTPISAEDLETVGGGASRIASRVGGGSDQLVQLLDQVTSSIKDLANQRSSSDPMQMMMMMLMMGGMGGGGGSAAAPAPAAAPAAEPTGQPYNVSINCGCR
ncbi:MAG: hypothetical protein ACTHU0_37165 [Kofleriaceae bacterium]